MEGPEAILMTTEIDLICQSHSFMCETEEQIGLLIGYRQGKNVYIRDCMQVKRLDKRPDRVEIGAETLVEASESVDRMKVWWPRALPSPQLIGWYHSHPHITVFPSEVDVTTQRRFEALSTDWIGLIYGVFNYEKDRLGERVQLIAFQSNTDDYERRLAETFATEEETAEEKVPRNFRTIPIGFIGETHPRLVKNALNRLKQMPHVAKEELEETFRRLYPDQSPLWNTPMALHDVALYEQFIASNIIALKLTSNPAETSTTNETVARNVNTAKDHEKLEAKKSKKKVKRLQLLSDDDLFDN